MRKLLALSSVVAFMALGTTNTAQTRSTFVSYKYIINGLLCIHTHEGAWNANTGNGYYGGLQMDYNFMKAYGYSYLTRWGTANNWSIKYQLKAGVRAYLSGRYWNPWPNTARLCGLI